MRVVAKSHCSEDNLEPRPVLGLPNPASTMSPPRSPLPLTDPAAYPMPFASLAGTSTTAGAGNDDLLHLVVEIKGYRGEDANGEERDDGNLLDSGFPG